MLSISKWKFCDIHLQMFQRSKKFMFVTSSLIYLRNIALRILDLTITKWDRNKLNFQKKFSGDFKLHYFLKRIGLQLNTWNRYRSRHSKSCQHTSVLFIRCTIHLNYSGRMSHTSGPFPVSQWRPINESVGRTRGPYMANTLVSRRG